MTDDPYRYFRVEARDLHEQLARGALELERGASAAEVVPKLLRLAHTLKGAARVVRQREIADLAHAIEEVLGPHRESSGSVPAEKVHTVVSQLDGINARLALLDGGTAGGGQPPEEPLRLVRADVGAIDDIVRLVTETQALVASVRRVSEQAARARKLAELLEAQAIGARAADAERATERARARAWTQDLRSATVLLDRGLTDALGRIERELGQVRAAAERVRLVPVATLFDVLERTARDAARTLGKRVEVQTSGGDLRVDAHVLGLVQPALVQVVRNSVTHGIELEAERRAKGKPAAGVIRIEVARRSRTVVFLCTDDGRGVDLEAVRRMARLRGVLAAGADGLGAAEIVSLLLRGGISTSADVTELAGRGIGLDLVRDACTKLGGDVRVETESGRGTRVEMIVPALASAVDLMLVEAGGCLHALPSAAVERALRVSDAAIGGGSLVTDDGVVPFAPLVRCLGGRSAPGARAWSVLLVRGSAGVAAIGVDRVSDHSQRVVRPPPAAAPLEPIVSGVALDVDGTPILVLDPSELVAAARGAGGSSDAADAAPTPCILVVDDSLTTRMLEQSILELAGFDVDLAASGEEALEVAHRRRYDCLLVDVEMPGIDGFEVVRRVRADPRLHDVPAILVTSRASREDRLRGEAAGADGYIVKGEFDQNVLLERIRKLLRGRT